MLKYATPPSLREQNFTDRMKGQEDMGISSGPQPVCVLQNPQPP